MSELSNRLANEWFINQLDVMTLRANRPIDLAKLEAELLVCQSELAVAQIKFNNTNPSDRKRLSPPGYVTWAQHNVNCAQKSITERDDGKAAHTINKKRLEWLINNLAYVDSKIE